jgi:predicted phage terminase large subunit-like protein
MLLLPPGAAKSTYTSVIFPAWWMAMNPQSAVIAASHTASLAYSFGRKVRDLMTANASRLEIGLARHAGGAGQFDLRTGGNYFAIGVRGAVTGRRADLALIDDPISCFRDAESPRSRDLLWNWFRSELVTRLKPHARLVVAMTRWHHDDLAGRLLEQPDWTTICLPALAEEDDPMGRLPGDALWPEWEDKEAILAKRAVLGERTFVTMYQQAPQREQGRLFDLALVKTVLQVPLGQAVRAWDLAGSSDISRDPDWTVGIKLVCTENREFVVADVRRVRIIANEVPDFIREVAEGDGKAVRIALSQDPGQAGVFQISALTKHLYGYSITSMPNSTSKLLRAGAVATQMNAGNVGILRAAWNADFMSELEGFPYGAKDDQVDALAYAFNTLADLPPPARFDTINFFQR